VTAWWDVARDVFQAALQPLAADAARIEEGAWFDDGRFVSLVPADRDCLQIDVMGARDQAFYVVIAIADYSWEESDLDALHPILSDLVGDVVTGGVIKHRWLQGGRVIAVETVFPSRPTLGWVQGDVPTVAGLLHGVRAEPDDAYRFPPFAAPPSGQ
jgi:hypothetical protein